MNLLVDTHVLVWMFLDDPRLSAPQRALLTGGGNRLFVSAASVFEITMKFRLGRLAVPREIAQDIERICVDYEFHELAVSIAHASMAGRLPGTHRDPFDRILAAQSIIESLPLVTADPAFKAFEVEVLW